MNKTILALSVCAIAAPLAAAKPSLWSYPRVDQGLFDLGVAFGIKENCETIEERKFYGISFLLNLSNYAQDQGYTAKEVKAFVKDDEEEEKLRKRVTEYLNDQGLDPATPNALCAYGEQQIAEGTQVGKFLRKN